MESIVPTELEKERRRRINVALWAYAYEVENASLVSDATFDTVCGEVDLKIRTNNIKLDNWFKKNFDPCTGQWVYNHPELPKLKHLYNKLKGTKQ